MTDVLHRSLMHRLSNTYFTIEALEDGLTVTLSHNAFQYRIEDGEWYGLNAGEITPEINAGQKIQFKMTDPTISGLSGIGTFTITESCNIEGNIMSLYYGDDFVGKTDLTGKDYAFSYLFSDCKTIKNAKNLVLPATTLVFFCYRNMFNGCRSLVTAPELPATTLENNCYQSMFRGCTSLVNAPVLPATTLAQSCYDTMFYGCTSLVTAHVLPSTTLAHSCYNAMFDGCTSLVTAPELPATTLADRCYQYMFNGCRSLVNAPVLPATTLETNCYYSMFDGCTSLKTAPELPATTLASYCYSHMFDGCSKLNYIKMLAADIANNCLNGWVTDVASTGIFVKNVNMNSLPSGVDGIPTGWDVRSECSKEYFTIESLEDGLTVRLSQNASYYRIDNGTWTSLSAGSYTPSINAGQKIQFKMTNPTISTTYGIGIFTISKSCNIEGNIMSLYYGDDFIGQTDLTGKNYAFYGLFSNCTKIKNAENLVLPSTTLASYCYYSMFNGCTSLVTAPALPATTLADRCYQYMFNGCRSLVNAPVLPSTTLAQSCYNYMFGGCTSLVTAPKLPATTLASYCYGNMFIGCTSLTTAPALPAETLANNCYYYMFNGCTSLTTAPELPAETLASYCYGYMFSGCTSLTTAPALPAETLTSYCYAYIFKGCTSLTTAPALPAETLAVRCYQYMFLGCTSLVNAPELPSTRLASYCYYHMFEGCTSLVNAPALPAETLASDCYNSMFLDCTSLVTAPELPSETLATYCYGYMFDGCTSLVTAPELPATTLVGNCYYRMFYGCTSLVTAPELPSETLADYCYHYMFYGCSNLNYIKMLATDISASNCLYQWVNGVSSTGTFVKHTNMTSLPSGVSGIPTGWDVVDHDPYLTFVALEDDCIVGFSSITSPYYRINNGTWGTWTQLTDGSTTPAINAGQKIQFKMTNPEIFENISDLPPGDSGYGVGRFSTNKKCNVEGNVMSLLYGDDFVGKTDLTGKDFVFYNLFRGCGYYDYEYDFYCDGIINAKDLILPATTLSNYCYQFMFYGCEYLVSAPELPATTLSDFCYRYMFYGCESLVDAPSVLPAETLVHECYHSMFGMCSNLNYIKMLATDISASDCLYHWVSGVASTGAFVKNKNMNSLPSGEDGIPTGWVELTHGSNKYFTIEALEDGLTVKISRNTSYYRIDNGTWVSLSANATTPAINRGQKIQFKMTNPRILSSSGIGTFTISKSCNIEGNIMSLLYGDDFVGKTDLTGKNDAFYKLFKDCKTIKNAKKLVLPATTLATYCYEYMFYGCTSLVTAPELPATTLANYCYQYMFYGCEQLVSAPELPATRLYNYCYQYMFYGCEQLVSAPELPSTTLAESCYEYMFAGCTSLVTAPELPATTLASDCYYYMFSGCTSLVTAPVLPATTLATYCYSNMFRGCTSLVTAPELPATTLAESCYYCMFYGCTSLVNAPELPATTLATSCYSNMFNGCTSLVSAPELPSTTLSLYCYGNMFNGCTSLVTAPELPAETLVNYCYQYMFQGCTSLVTAPELPSTRLVGYCYYHMFRGCTSLVSAPELPATTLANYCYYSMFSGCTSLVSAPELPATTLATSCYSNMFNGCTSLVSAPELPAETLANYCYQYMFQGCTSLVTAPELPATTLADYCYFSMFEGCTSLVTAPELPATTLADDCYYSMFEGCTSLVTAPALPATTLEYSCYQNMFDGCSKLNYIKMLATDISAVSCLTNWVSDVAITGTFVKSAILTSLPRGVNGIPTWWDVEEQCVTPSLVNPQYVKNYVNFIFNDGMYRPDSRNIKITDYIPEEDLLYIKPETDIRVNILYKKDDSIETIESKYLWRFDYTLEDVISDVFRETSENIDVNNICIVIENLILPKSDDYGYYYDISEETEKFEDKDWMRILSLENDNIISLDKDIKYSLNKGDWEMLSAGNSITVNENDTIYFKGTEIENHFNVSKSFNVEGNIMSLLYEDDFVGQTYLTGKNNAFKGLFNKCSTLKSAKYLRLPATILANSCYRNMFRECTSLNVAPELRAKTMVYESYDSMFYGCTSLVIAPELPATITATYCYYYMFYGCTSLTTAPSILPTKTLSSYCYQCMFRGCTSLVTAPELPATTLATYCYYYMFYGCSKLNYIKMLATNIGASNCLTNWVYGVASTGTFVKNLKMTSLPSGVNGIPTGWDEINDYSSGYFTIEALEDGLTVKLSQNSSYTSYYRIDNGTWIILSATAPAINTGQKIQFRITNPTIPSSGIGKFTISKPCNIEGNIMSLLYGDDFVGQTDLTGKSNAFYNLFYNCSTIKNAKNLVLPAETLASYCYDSMFKGCTSLVTAPVLPAETLASYCYQSMFEGCASLVTAPALPATTLEYSCYSSMFKGCASLVTAPVLPAETLEQSCYHSMFKGCTSLVNAPVLPAETLEQYCYNSMFDGCTSLVTAPELPATTLANYCYTYMFQGCTSLVTAPELLSTRLASYCYTYMFKGCSKLNYIKMLATNISATNCLNSWVSGVSSTGTFVKNALMTSLPSGVNGIPTGWDVLNHYPYSYFTIEALEDGLTVKLSQNSSQYRIGYGEWKQLVANEITAEINTGQTIQFKITDPTISGLSGIGTFTISKPCNIEGNIMSLLYGDDFVGQTDLTGKEYVFSNLFYNCSTIESAKYLVIPAETLAPYCYHAMFSDCVSLIEVPELPAEKLSNYCYYNMFYGCTSLETAPELKSTTLVRNCYSYMFYGCSNLNYIQMLATDISAKNCLSYWVSGVANTGTFVKATILPDGINGIPTGWDVTEPYFTIVALEDDLTVSLTQNAYQCRVDNGEWLSLTAGTVMRPINAGQKIQFKMTNPTISTSYGIGKFTISKSCNIEGNIMSLLYGDDFEGQTDLTGKNDVFTHLFYNCSTIKNAKNLVLPATTLESSCYISMFEGCTSLVTAPELPATTLADSCYEDMFYGCTSLVNAPEVLPATTLSSDCYCGMFDGCTSLVNAPELPATRLADYCYQYMFSGCTSLVNAPALPATRLASDCYFNMFYGCTSLVNAPALPATSLAKASNCYYGMFEDCSNLNYIKMLATDISGSYCLYNWVSGVASTGTFVKNPQMTSLPSGDNGIPTGWNINEPYFTIEALEDGLNVSLTQNTSYYRVYNGRWSTWTSLSAGTVTPSINTGQKIQFKMTNPTILTTSPYGIGTFTISKSCNIEGNIMSLLYGDNFVGQNDLTGKNYAFYELFKNCTTIKNAKNLVLPAETLASHCYYGMFDDCTSLTTAPALPATTLATYCYHTMFQSCTSLVTAPELPATTLDHYCYKEMFSYCYSLVTAPELPATTLKSYCYEYMFSGCRSLVNAPELPSTTLAQGCYESMFSYCYSLVNAPELPATTLELCCYEYMFSSCRSLVNAPKLPATTLSRMCYESMFGYCTSLVTAPELPATTLSSYCYSNMFEGCKSLVTAPELPATTLEYYCYYHMFYDCSKLNYINMLATNISETGCLTDWVYGVANTGIFVKHTNMTSLPSGVDGIPTGWDVIDHEEKPYFTIEALEDGLIVRLTLNTSYYRIDNEGWTQLSAGTVTPSINAGQKIQFKMTNPTILFESGIGTFTISKSCNIEGNIMSLLYGDNFVGQTDLTGKNDVFYHLFYNCTTIKNAKNLVLPATTLESDCYSAMFQGCTSLVTAPELPAETLANSCYSSMFSGCTSLETAPALPATTLASYCYNSMFNGCSKLVTAPELPVTTLVDYCYNGMFSSCRSLENAPELPATTLADNCYNAMFFSCISLVTAPILPATTLATGCYRHMFNSCTKLNYIKMLATDISASYCLGKWVSGVSSEGIFVKNVNMTSLTTGSDGIPTNWDVIDAIIMGIEDRV